MVRNSSSLLPPEVFPALIIDGVARLYRNSKKVAKMHYSGTAAQLRLQSSNSVLENSSSVVFDECIGIGHSGSVLYDDGIMVVKTLAR